MLRIRRTVLVSSVVAAASLAAAGAGTASRGQDFVTCDDGSSYAITVTEQPTDHSVGWGVGTISGGDHLIPTSFSGSAEDTTIGQTLFSFFQAKGDGNGQHNQSQVTCQTQTETGTLADFLEPGDQLPPGASLTDEVTFTLTVTAVRKP